MRGGKGGTRGATPAIPRHDSLISGAESELRRQSGEQSCFHALASGETQPRIKPVAAQVKGT